MRKGFTLIELIVVIIIVGILASVGMTQYTKVVEKGRA
ncbi:MAG: prepilin-type N-terminal cleavage/methylation domain-containing protein, partial [Candidatus Omnitrophica bacterium]|nr:prepilin-type N-terminal cleavage/methylation domain-containing protein [Candidatus Omnitrophota bacterium]MBU1922859.1 prepilin-type N-terminal cleavage/methylation domain-containing protein [Candidatus Omnitrophota bacterium]